MKEINPDLSKDIGHIEQPERRVLVRSLVIAIMGLVAALAVVFGMLISGNKLSQGEKDKIIAEQKEEIKQIRKEKEEIRTLYTNTLLDLVKSKHEFNDREKRLKIENTKTLRTQDSLLAIFKNR